MKIIPKNWRDFQHYKDRNPPWIRLHRKLLDDKDFQRLPVASRALAPMLWLLASESIEGLIDADPDDLAFRLRTTEKEINAALKPLIDKGFFSVERDAITPLADCQQVAVPETEALQRQRQRKARATPIPEGFSISERVRNWANARGLNHLDDQLDALVSYAKRKGATYVDWDEALMTAIRNDWAKVGKGSSDDVFAGAK